MALTQADLDQAMQYIIANWPKVRIPELPGPTGAIAPEDLLTVYMVGTDKTVKTTLGNIIALAGAQLSATLAPPAINGVVISETQINLSWTSVPNADTYKLYRGFLQDRSDAVLLYSGSNLSFQNTGLVPATEYYYFIKATGSGYQDSGFSSLLIMTQGAIIDSTPPLLTSAVVEAASPNKIVLTYNEGLFQILSANTSLWSVSGHGISSVNVAGNLVTVLLDTPVVGGENVTISYSGSVVKDPAGNLASTFLNYAVTNNVAIVPIVLPTPGTGAVIMSATEIKITWWDIMLESGYEIQRSDDGGNTFATIATPAAGTDQLRQYLDSTVVPATNYIYRLKAVGNGTTLLDSQWATVVIQTPGTTTGAFDTILTFNGSLITKDSEAGVLGTKNFGASNRTFEFNAIGTRVGTPMTMRIYVGAGTVTELIVDFPSEYDGKPFRFTMNSVAYYGNFANGVVTL